MKKDFRTIKNIILLIASALTLVAVTFSWFSMSRQASNGEIKADVSGSTLAVKYFESKDGGNTYSPLAGDLSMENMVEGMTAYYKMDVKTFKDEFITLIMSFDGLSASNARYVYFDYKLVCTSTGEILSEGTELKMSDYTSANVFAFDVSTYQKNGKNDFSVYYNVYVKTGGASISNADTTVSLGEVKLRGQQVS